MNPLVSVVTTVYNCEKYIEESIQSILDQTFKDFEFIIINDGSTDNTAEKIKNFHDQRIIVLNHDSNKKIPFRRNEGVDVARGKYIAIHDGDDVSLTDRLEKEFNFLEKHDNIFCVGGHAIKIDEEGKELCTMFYPPPHHVGILGKFIYGYTNPVIDPTTMFRKADFNELGGYSSDDRVSTVPDFDLWVRALITDRLFANLMVPLIRYRMNPDGVTSNKRKEMIRQHMTVLARNMRALKKKEEK